MLRPHRGHCTHWPAYSSRRWYTLPHRHLTAIAMRGSLAAGVVGPGFFLCQRRRRRHSDKTCARHRCLCWRGRPFLSSARPGICRVTVCRGRLGCLLAALGGPRSVVAEGRVLADAVRQADASPGRPCSLGPLEPCPPDTANPVAPKGYGKCIPASEVVVSAVRRYTLCLALGG